MAPRPCLTCGQPTTHGPHCKTCARAKHTARYGHGWATHSRQTIATHRAQHGDICPGWQRPPHPATQWVTDHDVGPLCATCNAVKADTYDKRWTQTANRMSRSGHDSTQPHP